MNERKARLIADMLGGDAFNSGGGVWLVQIYRPGRKLVVIGDESICEYANTDAFDSGAKPLREVILV